MNSSVKNVYPSIPYREANPVLLEKLKYDNDTLIHCKNVANLCTKFVKICDFNISDVTAYYSGIFHDIGKIKIDKSILNKNGTLTNEEFSQIKKHVSFGHDILINTPLPVEAAISAKFHHEKFDGTGYPFGLKGKNIPLIARIISICDVFDALTSDRPYRKAYTLNEAIHIIKKQESQFDPDLFSIFIANTGIFAEQIK